MEGVNLDAHTDWCLSGGADGADLQWGMVAGRTGHGVIHFSFAKHKTTAPSDEVVILTRQQLASADPYCKLANKTLKRRFPAQSQHVTNLLRRDWFQVAVTESCYAVSTFEIPIGTTIPLGTVLRNVAVKGGTAWAVTMFIDRFQRQACPCYVFDQELGQWFRWMDGGWQCIYEPLKPTGIWAGIGARDLNKTGKLAIRVLMDYRQGYHDEARKAANPQYFEVIPRKQE